MTHLLSLFAHCLVCCVLAAASMFHGFHPELVKCLAYSFLAATAFAEIVDVRRRGSKAPVHPDEEAPGPAGPTE